MTTQAASYDSKTGVYSYKKDGSWFFSSCPPEQIQSKRVDGKWYFIETCINGGGGGGGDLSAYATTEYVDEQIAMLEFPEDQDLSLYAKTTDMATADAATLASAKDYTNGQIDNLDISVDLSDYATQQWVLNQDFITEQPVTDGDAATLVSANEYTDEQIAKIEFPDGVDSLVDASNELTGTNTFKGLTYFDKSIISKSDTVLELKGDPNTLQHRYFKVRGNAQFSVYAYDGDSNDNARNAFSILMRPGDDYPTTTLNYLQDPVSNGHPTTLRYANATYAKKEDVALKPIVFKSPSGCKQWLSTIQPPEGKVAFVNAPELGGQKNSNKFFGNCNNGIRLHKENLKNASNEVFAVGETYNVSGFVTVYGQADGKLYLKAPVVRVSRIEDYIDIAFSKSGWLSPINYGRGSTEDTTDFVIIVEAFENG